MKIKWNDTSHKAEKVRQCLEREDCGRCGWCKPHRGENIERRPRRSWKFHSKRGRQFRGQ